MLYQLSYFRKNIPYQSGLLPAAAQGDVREGFATPTGILFVGSDGFEPPKAKASRFTVCPIWPLWNTPLI